MVRRQNGSAESVWRERLARFEKSNLKVKEFCQQEGVSDPAFYQWRKRLQKRGKSFAGRKPGGKRTNAAESFVPLAVPNLAFIEVEFPNGVRVRVPATNAEALRVALMMGDEVCRRATGA